MALLYKIELLKDESRPADDSAFIHLKENPPYYIGRTDKEDYDILPDADKNDFATSILDVSGVVELSITAYRIWVMKTPLYTWKEVLDPIVALLVSNFGEDGSEPTNGSPTPSEIDNRPDISRLGEISQRRSL